MNISRGVLVLITCSCAVLLFACGRKKDPRASGSDGTRSAVRVTRVQLKPIPYFIDVTGTLAAQEKSLLSAKVSGRLQKLNVDIGSVVQQGDVIAQIEPRDYELGLQQATAALTQARAAIGLSTESDDDKIELEQLSTIKQARAVLEEATKNRQRTKDLSASGIASQSELDTVEATYKVALTRYETSIEDACTRVATVAERRAELEIARKRLADASVRAPFDGIVQVRSANLGEFIASGAPILQLVKSNPLRLRLEVPERKATIVRVGQPVRLRVEGDTNVYNGHITRLSPALDELSRMLLIEADVPAQGSLRPGLFARAEILIKEDDRGLMVPTNALVTFAGLEKVVAVKDGKALERVVTTGRREGDSVEIISGVQADEMIVLNPGGLRTGQPVAVVEENQDRTALPQPGPAGQ